MTGFSADWLTLRAKADRRARDQSLATDVAARFGAGNIVDLGGGTGATYRALSPLMPGAHWRILDYDAALLAHAPASPAVTTEVTDLAADPEAIFTPLPDLVTASAFFDLVSADWITRFVALLARARVPLYAALTYDGREEWAPLPPHEEAALAAFHADMRRDKGFGPALGPDAASALAEALSAAGYRVRRARSDWMLARGEDDAMIAALANGGAGALEGALPAAHHRLWTDGRRGAHSVLVGHEDLLAEPA